MSSVPQCFIDLALKKATKELIGVWIIDDPDNGFMLFPDNDPWLSEYDDEDYCLFVTPEGELAVPTSIF